MRDIAIKVENLYKKFDIGHKKSGDLRSSFGNKLKNMLSPALPKEEFWALQDINFEIKKGEAVGIIGRNGAGKSTLLKILSRITEPTRGRFEIKGRVSSLLEVGTGFHPELTGRENIYLNGTILGMKRREIKAKFDEIVAFSGVEKFIDTPVKHYSSGMKVRLAFSVAAHLEPEILIIDEVLAVGDAEFQKKCLGKMDEVSKGEGRTVIFVSHNLAAVESLCDLGILLNNGKISEINSSKKVIQAYQRMDNKETFNLLDIPSKGNKVVNFKDADIFIGNERCAFNNGVFQIPFNSKVSFRLEIQNNNKFNNPVFFAITIVDINKIKIATLDNLFKNEGIKLKMNDTTIILCNCHNLPLNPGYYSIDLWCSDGFDTFQKIENALTFEVVTKDYYSTGKMQVKEKHGFLNLINEWMLQEL